MFCLVKQDKIEFKPKWNSKEKYDHKSTQSDKIQACDQTVQSLIVYNKSVETEFNHDFNLSKNINLNYDLSKLKTFLLKASKITVREIQLSIKFNEKLYYLTNNFIDLNKNKTLTTLFKINLDLFEKYKLNFIISDLTWNCNNNQLIVAFSHKIHENLCNHETLLLFFNLYINSNAENKLKPNYKLKFKYCIIKIINHPIKPSEFLIATKQGYLYIIDKKNLDLEPNQFIKHETCLIHKFDICFITYKKSNNELNSIDTYDEIVSASLDGRIVHWKIKKLEKNLQVIKIYILDSINTKKNIVGIKCGSILEEDIDHLLIGCEEGSVLSVSLKINDEKNKQVSLPITFNYKKHEGYVTSIESNKKLEKLFFTCSIDGEVRIYQLYTYKPIIVIYNEYFLPFYKWIPNTNFMVGFNNKKNNILYINYVYKKNEKYYTKKMTNYIKESIFSIHINELKQIAIVNKMNEIYVFDTKNILISMEENNMFNY